MRSFFATLAVLVLLGPAIADEQAQTAQPAEQVPAATVVLRKGALIALRLLETVSSDTAIHGYQFKLEVSEDVTVDDVVVIPAGSAAVGEVIHAAKSGMLGKAGELTVTSRYLVVGDREIKLHGLLSGTGESRVDLAFFVMPFIRGKKIIIPVDTELVAKVMNDELFALPAAAH